MMKRLLFTAVLAVALLGLNGTIDLNELFNYDDQFVPNYVNRDNTPPGNAISDAGATLGRVLFYDVNLSANNTVACAHCHKQEFAFGDNRVRSEGLNGGLTGRHSMRLVNARFSNETRFFWDERAVSLEDQTTRPIKDHVEMGFSGTDGDPTIDSLILKLSAIPYYQELFTFVYGSPEITELKMREALAFLTATKLQKREAYFFMILNMKTREALTFSSVLVITAPSSPSTTAGRQVPTPGDDSVREWCKFTKFDDDFA